MTALTPIEVATGIVFGASPRRLPRATLPPAAALEAALLPAVLRGPTFVSFSGGRDSSAVLATATAVARREGRPDPIPVTIRAEAVAQSHESDWQERVVRHLGLDDWVRIEAADQLDCVGPYAQRALGSHGLLWPFNVHFHAPMLAAAEGGTLLTGVGGDELWMSSRAPRLRRRRQVLRLAPHAARRAALTRRQPITFPWLRPIARAQAQRLAAGEAATVPWTVRGRMAYSRGMRYLAVATDALDRIAVESGSAVHHPLLDLGLWAAVADTAPRHGFTTRDAALASVAGTRVPADLVTRRGKARFDAVFFNQYARTLAREWDGGGVPAELVDAAALRVHWLGDGTPDPHSLTLLQALWLRSAGDRVEQPVARLGQ